MKKLLLAGSFFIVLLASAYYININYHAKDIIQGKKYTLQIIDSIQITDDIVPCNYYAQNGYWIKMGISKANFYEMTPQHPLKVSIRGATSLCPDPNKRISRKNLERARMFSVGKNIILTYDDINERFHVYNRQGKFIKTLKPDMSAKKTVSGCNYSETNDSLVVISVIDKEKHFDSLRFDKNVLLYHIINLKTGKTMYKVGSFPEIYQTKKYLGYLPHHNFATDFENKRIFYQCEGSPLLHEVYWETGKTQVFGIACEGYTPPAFELKQPIHGANNDYVSKLNEYINKSYIAKNIYYEPKNNYIFRDFILPIKEGHKLRNHVLQIYEVKNKTLLTEIMLDNNLSYLVYVDEDLSVWFEKNRLPYETNTVLYKTKLVAKP
jgi:hypothetical protein